MCETKKKIILFVIIVIGFISITKFVYASDTKIYVTKETNEFIEGTIEFEPEEDNSLTELSSNSTSQDIDPATFYYSQLKNELSRNVYNELKKDTTGIGTTKLNFSNQTYSIDVTKFLNDQTYAKNIVNSQIKGYVYDAIVAFSDDNPKIYWYYNPKIKTDYKIDKINNKIEYNGIIINSIISERSDYLNFNNKLEEVVNSIDGTSTYEIVKKCHDYICNTVVYTIEEDTIIDQTAYDALINKKGVCDAEARAFKLLCDLKGIKCIKVIGYAILNNEKGPHAWNYVYHPDEKKWYAVDTTWDNNKHIGKTTTYNYFLVGKNTSIKISSGTVKFIENHVPGFKNYTVQSYTPQVPELSDEAYEKFSGKIQRNTNNKTNQPVIARITFNREIMEAPAGWTLSSDKKAITKTFTENTTEKHTIINTRGEKLSGNINITNIDKIAPEAVVTYSNKDRTGENITVTITGNEELQSLSGWKLSQDKKTLTKIYTDNKKEDIVIKDLAGNSKTIPIEINNIDKTKPILTITYNLSELNNNKVLVTIVGNEELQEIEGWTISEDKKTLSKTYTENGLDEIQVKNLIGNISKKKILINSINTNNENFILQYTLKDNSDGNVEATIIADRELKPKEGWTLSQEKNSLTKVYIEETTEEVEVEDLEGKKSKILINSSNIVEDFLTNVIYSIEEKTNQDVEVTINSNKQLKELEGWTLSQDKKSMTKIYSNNTKEEIIVSDISNNQRNETIEINNIDKEPPQLQITYSDVNDNGEITVTITSNEELLEKKDWTLSEDKKSITRIYNIAIEDDIKVEDLAGNEQTIKLQITEIQLSPIEDENKTTGLKEGKIEEILEYNPKDDEEKIDSIVKVESTLTQKEIDETTQSEIKETEQSSTESPKMILPYTGNHIIIVFALAGVFTILGIISYKRYIRYRGIDK